MAASRDSVIECAVATAAALHSLPYAVVGGAACQLLGSTRITTDVDIVVPKGGVIGARSRLAKTPSFVVHPQTRHTVYAGTVDVEILSPPRMFRVPFDAVTPVHEVPHGDVRVRVLHPLVLLNSKCGSVFQRSGDRKRDSDYFDIRLLLGWLLEHEVRPTKETVPNASNGLADELLRHLGGDRELWVANGYDFTKGGSGGQLAQLTAPGEFPPSSP